MFCSPFYKQSRFRAYRISPDGRLNLVTDELKGSIGLAFSEDGRSSTSSKGRATPYCIIWSYDIANDGFTLSSKKALVTADDNGGLDRMSMAICGAAGVPRVPPAPNRKASTA